MTSEELNAYRARGGTISRHPYHHSPDHGWRRRQTGLLDRSIVKAAREASSPYHGVPRWDEMEGGYHHGG